MTKTIANMEVTFIELHGRNKNTPYLVAVAYQPTPYESDKLLWLENITFWSGNQVGRCYHYNRWHKHWSYWRPKRIYKALQKHHSFNLHHHITKPTRKDKSLIDNICSNVPKKLIHNDVIYTDEINDHVTPFIIVNIKKNVANYAISTLEMEENLIWINMSTILANYI